MAQDSPAAARDIYLRCVRSALGVVARDAALITNCRRPEVGREYYLILRSDEAVRVQNATGDRRYWLAIRQRFQVARTPDGGWRIALREYDYELDDDTRHELLAYHWQPRSHLPVAPHLHIKGHPLRELQKAHLPTAHVSVESFIRFLIRDLQVRVTTQDYERILDDGERQSAQVF